MVQRYKTFRSILALSRLSLFGAKAEHDTKPLRGGQGVAKAYDEAVGTAKSREKGEQDKEGAKAAGRGAVIDAPKSRTFVLIRTLVSIKEPSSRHQA